MREKAKGFIVYSLWFMVECPTVQEIGSCAGRQARGIPPISHFSFCILNSFPFALCRFPQTTSPINDPSTNYQPPTTIYSSAHDLPQHRQRFHGTKFRNMQPVIFFQGI
jgi:hypothetical protein